MSMAIDWWGRRLHVAPRADGDDARRATHEAREALERTQRRAPEVHAVADKLRAERARNGFADLITESMRPIIEKDRP